jgi:hypothetical protein
MTVATTLVPARLTLLMGGERGIQRRAVTIAAIAAFLLLQSNQTNAHGGRLRCELAPAGPYVVSVWTTPDPARVGVLDFSASILRSDTRQPVSVQMRLTARATSTPGFIEGVGLREAGGFFDFLAPPLYHVKVELPAQGRWHVSVSVTGAAGHGDTGFDMDVAPALRVPWGVIAASAAVAVLLLATWFVVNGEARRRRAG